MQRSLRAARRFRSPLAGVTLVVVCLLAHWPGAIVLPPVDRDEARFAQATRQVAEAAVRTEWTNVLIPHIQDRPRINKPPLVYWLGIAPSVTLDSPHHDLAGPNRLPTGNIFAYRLVSLLSAMVAVLLTWRIGLTLRFHPAAAWTGAVLLATCTMVSWDARQARADELLMACTCGAMWCLAHLWRHRRSDLRRTRGWAIALAVFLALGVLAKGVALLIVALAAASVGLWRRGAAGGAGREWVRHLRAPWVSLAAVLPTAIWLGVVQSLIESAEPSKSAVKDLFSRVFQSTESHWGPPGYHLLLLAILFFPGSLATCGALARALRRAWSTLPAPTVWTRLRTLAVGPIGGDDRTLFCLAWIVAPWIVFELSVTKLPHYTLPLYPAIALLSARHLVRMAARAERIAPLGAAVFVAIALAIGVGIPSGLAAFGGYGVQSIVVAAVPGAILGALVAFTLFRSRMIAAQWWAIGLTVATFALVVRVMLPEHPDLWISSRLMAALPDTDSTIRRPIACVGYHEDSLIFLARGGVERMGPVRADRWFTEIPCGRAFVEKGVWEYDPARFTLMHTVRGFNYSSGSWETVELIEPTVQPETGGPPGYDPGSPPFQSPHHP